ncbi:MAG: sigma-70 family RNA polymerase sigma factor [Tepidisphaeraceae bacterium]
MKADATLRFYAEVWPHAAEVQRLANILCRDAPAAEDLAQEALLKAFRFIDRFEPGTDAKKWLFAITRNCRADRLRIEQRTAGQEQLSNFDWEPEAPATVEDSSFDGALAPTEILEAFSDREIIAALQRLPEEIRWTLLLVDIQGMDHVNAAEVLDVPVGTVKSRAHRGRNMLREILRPMAARRQYDQR